MLKKRLKSYYKRRKLAAAHISHSKSGPQYDYYLVIDFEATCQEHNPDQYKHEIIEFPVVLIDSHKKEVVSFNNGLICCTAIIMHTYNFMKVYIISISYFCLQIDEFHAYVKPTLNPQLTSFCTGLTGITQVHRPDQS